MKRSINHKRYSGYPEELSLLKGFKVVGVGCGDIEKEGATSIMLMNDHNVAVASKIQCRFSNGQMGRLRAVAYRGSEKFGGG